MQTKQQEFFFSVHNLFSLICSSYCCPLLRLERGKKERRADAAITEVATAMATMEAATAMATMEAATVTAMATTEAATMEAVTAITEAATTEAVTAITEVAITEAVTVITEAATTEVTADMDIGSFENKTCLYVFMQLWRT
jgi:hypothetical protein